MDINHISKLSSKVPVKVIDLNSDVNSNALPAILVTLDGMVIDVKPVAFWNALLPILVTLDGMVIDFKPITSWNALSPILVTLDGMVIELKNTLRNALLAILPYPSMITVVACGKLIGGFKVSLDVPVKVIDVKPTENALKAILVTLSGMVIDDKLVAPKNALLAILPYPSMITVVACGKLDIDGFKISPDVPVKVIDVKPVAPPNALGPILVRFDVPAKVIDAKPVAPSNALSPILV
jgi:hypothetical protein